MDIKLKKIPLNLPFPLYNVLTIKKDSKYGIAEHVSDYVQITAQIRDFRYFS